MIEDILALTAMVAAVIVLGYFAIHIVKLMGW